MIKRFVILEGIRIANITEAEEDFGLFMGWMQSDTGNIGDEWNGTEFITPPPPEPTPAEYSSVVAGYLHMRSLAKRDALRDAILAAHPGMNTMTAFITACDNWTEWPE